MKYWILHISLAITSLLLSGQVQPPFWVDKDTTLCSPQPVTLTANVNIPGANYATTSYSVGSIPYTPDPYNGGTPLVWQTNGDDEVHGPFNIGFTFCFMGSPRTQFYIGINGWVGFANGPTTYTSLAIPSTNANVPKECIMGPWQDWYPGFNNASVNYAVYGVAPYRRLVVSWDNSAMFSCTNLTGRFQIILYETSNIIENHIQNKPNCLTWGGGTAVQGLHDFSGTLAFPVTGRNSTQWTAVNDAVRYTPNGAFTPFQIDWYDLPGNNLLGSGSTITVNPVTNTQYYAVVTYLCSNGTDADTVDVNISTAINASTVFSDDTCNISSGTATVNVSGGVGPYAYAWSNGDTQVMADSLSGGTYTVVITDVNGCTASTTATVNSLMPPVANFSYSPSVITLIDPEAQFTDLSAGATLWYWDFGDGNTSTTQHPLHTYLLDGTYLVTLIVENQFGCTDTVTQTLLVEGYFTFYIPNAFTPNNSGSNEIFAAEFTGIEEQGYEMFIFSRWGDVVFHTTDPNQGWYGSYNNSGPMVQEGVYVYLFKFRDFKSYGHEIRGHVTVIK
ncbi:MAG: gliding motility-associated C-terminal domain-containing protein [Bacteroidia bacterium]|nr:gliding motility-associated C-terminal domain-containing protein [Bacteroidia bacterium]